jgi:hypothetical protein
VINAIHGSVHSMKANDGNDGICNYSHEDSEARTVFMQMEDAVRVAANTLNNLSRTANKKSLTMMM